MRSILRYLTLLLTGGLVQCTTSRYVWNSEAEYYALPIWHDKVKAFDSIERPAGTATVFIGDSMTEGFNVQYFLGDSTLINMGIGGDFTQGVLKRLDQTIRLQPKKVFIMIGINDVMKRVPAATTRDNYRRIIERLNAESPQTAVYVQSCLPLKGIKASGARNADLVAEVRALNAYLQGLNSCARFTWVDLYPLFEVKGKYLNPSLTYDGVHLNQQGNQVWADAIRSYLP